MKISTAAFIALTLAAGTASAMTHPASVAQQVNSAYTNGTVNVHLNGSTATLVGHVDSALDVSQIVQAALATDEVNKVINLISIK